MKQCCGGFSTREELVYDFVNKNTGNMGVERAKAFVPRALSLLDQGFLSRDEFLENLFKISYARIVPEEFWAAYDGYMQQTHWLE